jgi:YggT family protein
MSGFTAVGFFLVSLFFSLIIFVLWLRLSLRFLRVSLLNPLSHLAHTLTDPVVNPLYSLFKQKYVPSQKYDWIAFAVLVFVEFLKVICLCLLMYQTLFPFIYVIIYVLADLIIQPCTLLFYALLIRVIMSYLNPNWQHPVAHYLYLLTEPLLNLGRKIIPNISGFDFSPFIIMIILKIITLFIGASLPWQLL